MKRTIRPAVAVATLFGLICSTGTTWGQAAAPPAEQSAAIPHKIGLIDMAHVFKKYQKFEVMREDLKKEFEQTELGARAKAEELKRLQEELKGLKSGTADYVAKEAQLVKESTELQAFAKQTQLDMLRRESEIYRTIYLEVTDLVKLYSEKVGYTLVMRFSRDGLDDAENPQEVIQRMNQTVIYHQIENDITEPVLNYLNRRYQSTAGTPTNRTGQKPVGTSPRN